MDPITSLPERYNVVSTLEGVLVTTEKQDGTSLRWGVIGALRQRKGEGLYVWLLRVINSPPDNDPSGKPEQCPFCKINFQVGFGKTCGRDWPKVPCYNCKYFAEGEAMLKQEEAGIRWTKRGLRPGFAN